MRLSKRGEYALRALMELTFNFENGVKSIHEIAQQGGIPKEFLVQILLQLKNARLVESQRGAEGGYRLRKSPQQITLGEVVRLIDGPLAPLKDRLYLQELILSETRYRSLYEVLLDVGNSVAAILDHTTLADLCAPRAQAKSQPRKTRT